MKSHENFRKMNYYDINNTEVLNEMIMPCLTTGFHIQELVGHVEVREAVIVGLIALLTPTLDDVIRPAVTDTPLPQHLQQVTKLLW